MVLTLAIPLRAIYGLHNLVTIRHIDNCAKLMLICGSIVAYGYAEELFMGWYGGSPFDWFMDWNRMSGPYLWAWWTIVFCNVLTPQVLWFRQVRQNVPTMFLISIIVQIGMWTERFVIVVTSLHRDFMPTAWGRYQPTIFDWSTLLGTMGFFLLCFFLFVRLVPMISMSEVRELVHTSEGGQKEPKEYSPKYAY